MASGIVVRYDSIKGFGFIEQDEGGEILFHHSAFAGYGFRILVEGDRVSFEIETTSQGLRAVKIRREFHTTIRL